MASPVSTALQMMRVILVIVVLSCYAVLGSRLTFLDVPANQPVTEPSRLTLVFTDRVNNYGKVFSCYRRYNISDYVIMFTPYENNATEKKSELISFNDRIISNRTYYNFDWEQTKPYYYFNEDAIEENHFILITGIITPNRTGTLNCYERTNCVDSVSLTSTGCEIILINEEKVVLIMDKNATATRLENNTIEVLAKLVYSGELPINPNCTINMGRDGLYGRPIYDVRTNIFPIRKEKNIVTNDITMIIWTFHINSLLENKIRVIIKYKKIDRDYIYLDIP